MKYEFMQKYHPHIEVKKMAEALQVARSGYYAKVMRKDSLKRRMDLELVEHTKSVYYKSKSIYGSPRVTVQLRREGLECGKNRVARLMRLNHPQSRKQRKFKAITNSKHSYPVASNLLEQNFSATSPNTIWVADISYIATKEGWLYLAVIKDIFTQKVVGWSMDKTMTRKLVIDALQMACAKQKPDRGLLLHSDRGVQYAYYEYQILLKEYGILCSTSRSGNPYDNAPMESFFSALKTEWVHHYDYKTRSEAKSSLFEYIERFYNPHRLNFSVGYRTPCEFEYDYS